MFEYTFEEMYVFQTLVEQTANTARFYRFLHIIAARSVFTP